MLNIFVVFFAGVMIQIGGPPTNKPPKCKNNIINVSYRAVYVLLNSF